MKGITIDKYDVNVLPPKRFLKSNLVDDMLAPEEPVTEMIGYLDYTTFCSSFST